jgi:hypothetical protein
VLESYTSGAVSRKPMAAGHIGSLCDPGAMQDFNFSYRSFAVDRYNGGILKSQQLSPRAQQKL